MKKKKYFSWNSNKVVNSLRLQWVPPLKISISTYLEITQCRIHAEMQKVLFTELHWSAFLEISSELHRKAHFFHSLFSIRRKYDWDEKNDRNENFEKKYFQDCNRHLKWKIEQYLHKGKNISCVYLVHSHHIYTIPPHIPTKIHFYLKSKPAELLNQGRFYCHVERYIRLCVNLPHLSCSYTLPYRRMKHTHRSSVAMYHSHVLAYIKDSVNVYFPHLLHAAFKYAKFLSPCPLGGYKNVTTHFHAEPQLDNLKIFPCPAENSQKYFCKFDKFHWRRTYTEYETCSLSTLSKWTGKVMWIAQK